MFDKKKAVSFITEGIDPRAHKGLDIPLLSSQALDADLAYMARQDVMDDEGIAGEGYYDDDEAFEEILDALMALNGSDDDTASKLAAFLDDYMEARDLYMENEGLISYE